MFVFFKQETAYEMRISDWSSDVCSSDLRIADHFDEMRRTVPEGTVVMVSHADVIRAAVCHVLGLSPDNWQRFEITPGSISRIAAEAEGYRLLSLNERSEERRVGKECVSPCRSRGSRYK